jgi:hypothetical protein
MTLREQCRDHNHVDPPVLASLGAASVSTDPAGVTVPFAGDPFFVKWDLQPMTPHEPAKRRQSVEIAKMTWAGLLQHVLDDDERTRRAERLLSCLTTWVVVIGIVVVTTGVILLNGPIWAPAGAVGIGALSAGFAWLRRRRKRAAHVQSESASSDGSMSRLSAVGAAATST